MRISWSEQLGRPCAAVLSFGGCQHCALFARLPAAPQRQRDGFAGLVPFQLGQHRVQVGYRLVIDGGDDVAAHHFALAAASERQQARLGGRRAGAHLHDGDALGQIQRALQVGRIRMI